MSKIIYKQTNSGKIIPTEGVEISQEDFGTLCICALRYCHGRRTYMPELVQSIVRTHFRDLSERDLQVITDDKEHQYQLGLWGDPCDKVKWDEFYKALKEFRGTLTDG